MYTFWNTSFIITVLDLLLNKQRHFKKISEIFSRNWFSSCADWFWFRFFLIHYCSTRKKFPLIVGFFWNINWDENWMREEFFSTITDKFVFRENNSRFNDSRKRLAGRYKRRHDLVPNHSAFPSRRAYWRLQWLIEVEFHTFLLADDILHYANVWFVYTSRQKPQSWHIIYDHCTNQGRKYFSDS